MGEDTIQFVVSLKGGAEAAAQIGKVKTAVNEAGGSVNRLGGMTAGAGKANAGFTSGLKSMLVQLGLVGLAYKGWSSAKTAITWTKELAENTHKLTGATGLSVEKASALLTVTEALGVPQQSLTTGFTKLSKEAVKQSEATGKTITAFDKLGLSTKFVREHAGDFNGVLDATLERLRTMPGGIHKAALESELFGKGYAALNPLLGEGAGHLEHLLSVADKYGASLHGGVNKELDQLREAQLESTLATDGLRISFTKLAEPSILSGLKAFARLKNDLRTGNMTGFNKEIGKMAVVAEKVLEVVEEKAIEGFGQAGPRMARALWRGFSHASLGNQALIGLALASKMGLTGAVFGGLGKRLGGALAGGIRSSGAWQAAGAEAEAALATGFSGALVAGGLAIGGIALTIKAFMSPPEKEVPYGPLHKSIQHSIATGKPIHGAYGSEKATTKYGMPAVHDKELEVERKRRLNAERAAQQGKPVGKSYRRREEAEPAHGAWGASTLSAGLIEVGERGPELLSLPAAATVAPMAPGSLAAPDGDIVIKIGPSELARINRRAALQSQASGA